MITRRSAAVALSLSLFAVACGSDDAADNPTTAAPSDTAATVPAATDATADPVTGTDAPDGAVLALASTDLGEIVVDSAGNTLYLFVSDAQGESTCYDQCEGNWPIVRQVSGVGEGLDGALLGTTTRTNGDVQATYNGWPLYRFGLDVVPGDTNGQGVGDIWYVLDAAGDAIGR